jgi:hypothetical protein
MMRFILIFLLFCSTLAYSFDYKKAIQDEVTKQFGNAAYDKFILLDYNSFVTIKEDTFVVPNGYHYVFKIGKGKIQRLDQSTFHGGNFNRFLFAWKNQIYALGGYGFFNTNNNLENFNFQLKGWNVFPTYGKKPNHILGVTYKNGYQIISFNNFRSGNQVEKDKLDSSLYQFNLSSRVWKKYFLNSKACFKGHVFYAKDYVISIGEINSLVVRKDGLKYVLVKTEMFGLTSRKNEIVEIIGNEVVLQNYDNHKKEPLLVRINLDEIWDKNLKMNLIESKQINKENSSVFIITISVLILLVSVGFFYFFKKSKSTGVSKEYNELEQKLIAMNRVLNTEELDELLGIEHMDVDSKKFKRNRMINEMNQRHPDFIIRIKDDIDKRRYLYQVNK